MPAQNSYYSHVYNKGIENKVIFNEREDYEVFLSFLKEYLTARVDHESAKKEFTVNGRIFRGLPHQPKNYLNKVELIAYHLMPDHFHLLLHQTTTGSIEGFIRSLCTRYSIYFNKKYKRSGSLFQGPYKSAQVKDLLSLSLLTRYFHTNLTEGYSSYSEYLGTRITSWVKPGVVVSFTERDGYKYFVEKYEPTQKEKHSLERITIDHASDHLERRTPTENLASHRYLAPSQRPPEVFAITLIFAVLVGLGIRNINASPTYSIVADSLDITATPTPQVAGVSTTLPQSDEIKPEEIQEEITPSIILVVKINDGSERVNIRKEPTSMSEQIGEAYEGDTFYEFAAVDSGWYEIKLAEGSSGFISKRYIELIEEININK